MYSCIDDRYDAHNDRPYLNVADFLAMCAVVFGEAPTLTERADGSYIDETGALVLVPHHEECDCEACVPGDAYAALDADKADRIALETALAAERE